MLPDDVLIETNKYGCVIIQNNGAMKIVNFMHAQMAETRCSFLRLWTPGTRLSLTRTVMFNIFLFTALDQQKYLNSENIQPAFCVKLF